MHKHVLLLALSLTLAACSTQKTLPTAASSVVTGTTTDTPIQGVSNQSECAIFEQHGMAVVRVDYQTEQDRLDLVRTFEPIGGGKDEGYLLFDLEKTDFERLRVTGLERGWSVSIDEPQTTKMYAQQFGSEQFGNKLGAQAISNRFSCYRTVEETYMAAQDLAKKYPDLVSWTSIGSTWLKNKGKGGYDLYVLKIGNKKKTGNKPKTLITTAIHGREYTTAELGTRFAEYLLGNYGKDADVTWILDSQEVHLILQANPDGRKKAESGILWRKNVNNTKPCRGFGTDGVDLNRNFNYMWGKGGSDTNVCSHSYMGSAAASEPEVQALQKYIRSIFPDKRGPKESDAAPLDTQGMYIDIHSFSELIMWPWSYSKNPAPNSAQFEALGEKLASFNGYTPQPAVGLYTASGTTVDFAYGELGVASFVYELGRAFFEDCNSFNRTILPDNLKSLMYALKVSSAPYQMASAPSIQQLRAQQTRSGDWSLSAQVVAPPQSESRQVTLGPAEVEYFVDTPPWEGGQAYAMSMQSSAASATLTDLPAGQHTIYVRAKDAAGNAGPVSALFVGGN